MSPDPGRLEADRGGEGSGGPGAPGGGGGRAGGVGCSGAGGGGSTGVQLHSFLHCVWTATCWSSCCNWTAGPRRRRQEGVLGPGAGHLIIVSTTGFSPLLGGPSFPVSWSWTSVAVSVRLVSLPCLGGHLSLCPGAGHLIGVGEAGFSLPCLQEAVFACVFTWLSLVSSSPLLLRTPVTGSGPILMTSF